MNELPRHLLPPHARSRTVTAVLGPTNTGKTHYAIERMLAYQSGIIGLPLRLLAREVYHKLIARVGPGAVALITGEEKIKPVGARYWVCTVEAMPQDVEADFLAIDEVQLAGDFERGHVFTDRLLHHRGRYETLLLGAATIRPLIQQLLPGAHITTRPRLSTLTYSGHRKITRLPARSAVVAFSAADVYSIAELIRRQRGGAAVVLGALSPRTRNAQVELFQSGAVDFLVATDAIGMGLNLDVDHIAFSAARKFDGYQFRPLNPAELAQVAGRAGRFMRDGTFGTCGRVDELDSEVVKRIEGHDFEPLKLLQWRNPALEFSSLSTLRMSLTKAPREAGLTRAPDGEDVQTLEAAWREPRVHEMTQGEDRVRLLWQTCQVPDYRKVSPAAHAELCIDIFRFLSDRGTLPAEWFAQQIERCNHSDGDIDTLSMRIAHIRTWSFIANQSNWLDDPRYWRDTTARLEDRLSDALHDRLAQRFVDKTTSVLLRRLRETMMLEAQVNEAGEVTIAEQVVGRLQGFRFVPEGGAEVQYGKELRAAAAKALEVAIAGRAERVAEAGNETFLLAANGAIRWQGEEIARLIAGESELEPRAKLLADDDLSGSHREWVQGRIDAWLRHHIATLLKPLIDLRVGEGLEGLARGIAFRLVEDLGVVERSKIAEDVKTLDQPARAALRRLGVRFGAYHLFVPAAMKPKPRELAAQLWALRHGGLAAEVLHELPHLAQAGRTSIPVNAEVPKTLYRVLGYRILGQRAVRVDILERLADLIRPLIAYRPGLTSGPPPKGTASKDGFVVTVEMTSLAGCSGEDFGSILQALGYRNEVRALAEHEAVINEALAKAALETKAKITAPIAADIGENGGGALADTSASSGQIVPVEAPGEISTRSPVDDVETALPASVEGHEPETRVEEAVVVAHELSIAETVPDMAPAPQAREPAIASADESLVLGPELVSEQAMSDDSSPQQSTIETLPMAPLMPAVDVVPATITIWRPARFERRAQPPTKHRANARRHERSGPGATAVSGEAGALQNLAPQPVVEGEQATNPQAERRPGRRERRPDHVRSPAQTTNSPPAGEAHRGPPPRAEDRATEQRNRRDKMPEGGRSFGGRPQGESGRHERVHSDKQSGDRPRGEKSWGDRNNDKRPKRESGNQAPRMFSSENPALKGVADPDSPFAKLALLKERLEADKKT